MMENAYDKLKLYKEINEHLLKDKKPSEFLNRIVGKREFDVTPFLVLKRLTKTEQSPKHHPEGNVWNHTMMVVDEAAKVREESEHSRAFMWAALLHDIGKPSTTKIRKGNITSYDHDIAGEKLSKDFLHTFYEQEEFIITVAALIRYHMHMLYILKNLPFQDRKGLLQRVSIHELALLCRCDRLGRTGADADEEFSNYEKLLTALEQQS